MESQVVNARVSTVQSEMKVGLAILSIRSTVIVRSWTDLFCSSLTFLLRLQEIKEQTQARSDSRTALVADL
jgi:hypothetical protein